MSDGHSPVLTLRVRAPEALLQFKELATSVAALRAELASLQAGGGGNAAFVRLSAEVKELRAGLEASRLEVERLTRQLEEQSKRTVRGITEEERAVRQRHQVERDEARKTAAAKKQAEQEALGAKASFGKVALASGLQLASGDIRAGSNQQAIQEMRDMELWLARGAAARAAALAEQRAAAAAQAALNVQSAAQKHEAARAEAVIERERLAAQRLVATEERRIQQTRVAQQRIAEVERAGITRSAARGVAAAGGGMFLTYGASIPTIATTFATGAALRESIKAGSDFQEQMAFVRIASEDSAESISKVSDEVLKLGGKTMFVPLEMAKGMRVLTQAGFETRDAMFALKPVMTLAALGEQDVGQAAQTAQGLMHAFGLDVKDVSHIVDVLAKAANISATDVKSMSEAMKPASTVARQYNVDIKEMSALLAVLASRNITGSAAGTALMNMFRELDPRTERAALAFEKLGVKVRDSVTKEMKPIVPLMKEFAAAFAKLNPEGQAVLADELFNNRAMRGFVNNLHEAFNLLPKFYREIGDSSGYANKSLEILEATASKQFAKFKGGLSSAFIQAFDSGEVSRLLSVLTETVLDPRFIAGVTGLVSGFTTLTRLVVEHAGPIAALAGSYALFAKVLPAVHTGVGALLATLSGASFAGVSGAALAARGGLFGLVVFGLVTAAYHVGTIDTVRSSLADFFEWSAKKLNLGLVNQLESAKERLRQGQAALANPDTPAWKLRKIALANQREREEVARLSKELGYTDKPVAPSLRVEGSDNFELMGNVAKLKPGTDTYNRFRPGREAIAKAKEAEDVALEKRKLAAEEQSAKNSLALLDIKHRYQLISEEEYLQQVNELSDKRAVKEKAEVDAAVEAAREKIAGMQLTENRLRAETVLRDLIAKQERLAADAEFVKEQRQLKVDGERKKRADEIRAEVSGIQSDIAKVGEQLDLKRRRAQQAIEDALLSGEDAARQESRLATEAAYLGATEKLKKEILQLEAKADEKSEERLVKLRPLLELLKSQKALQTQINEAEAVANYNRPREFTYGWQSAFETYAKAATNAAQHARDLFTASARAMESAIIKFANTGKFSFRDFANVVVQEMLRIQAARVAAGILGFASGFFPGLSSAGAGAGAGAPSSALASQLVVPTAHTGGVVGMLAASRAAQASLWLGAQRFHGGGLVGGEVPIIAKKGEGVFTPEQMRHLAPMNGGSYEINIAVNADSGEMRVSGDRSTELAQLGQVIAVRVREEIVTQKRPGGLLAKGAA